MPLTKDEKDYLKSALSLSENGGIYYEGARVQCGNANRWLLVGVGGLGTATLIRVKHEIMSRMQLPKDDRGKPTGAPPKNIAFMAIDTQQGSLEKMHYADTKFASNEMVYTGAEGTAWSTIVAGMYNHKEDTPDGYASFLPDQGALGALPADKAAGAMRLLGRVGLFNQQRSLRNKLGNAINAISSARGDIQVCLFAGIGGGTGSGSFIDIAFLLKQLLSGGGRSAPLSAYLFLPDIQDDDPSGQIDRPKNAYASLRELDQIIKMGVKNQNKPYQFGNGGPTITFSGNPFDLCYLIDKTDSAGTVKEKDEILTDVAESVFELIADQTNSGQNNKSGISEILANVTNHFNQVETRTPYPATYRYVSTCSDMKRIPFLEINTLVVSTMFKNLSERVFNIPVTRESLVQDLKELHLSSPNPTPGTDAVTDIENTLMQKLGVSTNSEADLTTNTRTGLITQFFDPNGVWVADDVWNTESSYKTTAPYKEAYDACANYQSEINSNLGTIGGEESKLGEFEKNFRNLVLNYLADDTRGPVYVADMVKGTNDCLIALFKEVKKHCDGVKNTCKLEANLAESCDDEDEPGFKQIFEYGKDGKKRDRKKLLPVYLDKLGIWQEKTRSANMYGCMAELCQRIINVLERYHEKVLEPLKDTVLCISEVFADNMVEIDAKHEYYRRHLDPHIKIYPKDFARQYAQDFNACVDNAQIAFLGYLKTNLLEWIGQTIEEQSDNPADYKFNAQKGEICIPDSLSRFISGFLDALYRNVTIEKIYENEFRANFTQSMQNELVRLFNNSAPFFTKNGVPLDETIVQEFAILFVPNSCARLKTAAMPLVNPGGTLHGRMQVVDSGDVSRISIVKVGEGYPLMYNANLNSWENTYEQNRSADTHLSVKWIDYPSPNVETTWKLSGGHNCLRTTDRNRRYREMFDFCYENGIILEPNDPNKLLDAKLLTSVPAIRGMKADVVLKESDITGDDIVTKRMSLLNLFDEVWKNKANGSGSINLKGSGGYLGGSGAPLENRMKNIRETIILDSFVCDALSKEYELLKVYVEKKRNFEIPQFYIKALVCKLIKVNRRFNVLICTTSEGANMKKLIPDDSVRTNHDDFDFKVYEAFKSCIDENAVNDKTWSMVIEKRWEQLLDTTPHAEINKRLAERIEKFKKSLDTYSEKLDYASNEVAVDNYSKRVDFYNLCILYAKSLIFNDTDDSFSDANDDVGFVDV